MNKFASTSIVISLGVCSLGAVLAEDIDAAAAAGLATALTGEDSGSFYLSQQRWVSTRSRAEVTAEMMAARRSGELAAIIGEDSGSVYLAHVQPASMLARAGVLEELRLARSSGLVAAINGEDSGSAYLARAATQRQARYVGPDRGHEDAPTVRLAMVDGER